jgi:hypothetical protein
MWATNWQVQVLQSAQLGELLAHTFHPDGAGIELEVVPGDLVERSGLLVFLGLFSHLVWCLHLLTLLCLQAAGEQRIQPRAGEVREPREGIGKELLFGGGTCRGDEPFDTVWRWRQQAQFTKARVYGHLESLQVGHGCLAGGDEPVRHLL